MTFRFLLLLLAASTAVAVPLQFNRDVRPILSNNCFFCHGPDKNHRKKNLRLDQRESALEKKAIVPGQADASELVKRIFTEDADELMPPPDSHRSLKPAEKEILRRWISEGAEYQPHWAYIVPVRPAVPEAKMPGAERGNPIDAFVHTRLQSEGLDPSPETDPRTLIRRLSLDIIGLPPTPAEVEAFVQACGQTGGGVSAGATLSPPAIEALVKRLIDSPHYGERMAVPWLDIVRFSDTVGYHGDQNQRIFPYRDYVIDAFNQNKRFDQFTLEQVAGDLLPNPTTEQLVATGFNRLNMMTREGGAQPKEYLAKYAADRVRTLGTAWLGTTLGCAECHDHKFDPVAAKDFYSFQAFFADVREWGVYQDYGYTPNPDLKGWSNEHPFPPEILVDSPNLKRRADKLVASIKALDGARISGDRSGGTDSPRWSEATAEKTADGFRTVVRGPVDVASVRVRVPQGPFALTLRAIKGESVSEPSQKTTPVAKPGTAAKKKSARPAYKPGPGDVPFAEAFADRKLPRYANTADVLSVLSEWRSDPAAQGKVHTAIYYFKQPVSLDEGEAITLLASTKDAKSVEFAVSDAASLAPDNDDLIAVAGPNWARFLQLRSELAECRGGKAWTQVTVSQPPRPIRLLPRGNWMDDSGELLSPTVPVIFQAKIGTGASQTASKTPNSDIGSPKSPPRLKLAKWLCSDENPLTARVIMNRLWAQFFGNGLSPKLDDLGAQGEAPSHPELLDWLAVEFRESGWDLKHMVRLIATSRTYCQSSKIRPELAEKDPANKLLARQNPRRLEAEIVRDNALAIAGLLNPELGGPSVFPWQPPGYYENLNFPQRDYLTQTDDRRLRRGVYMHWQRTFLHPMLANFDAPGREECLAERVISNTPQQALTLLNDPNFTEAALGFAAKMLRRLPQAGISERLEFLFTHALARLPHAEERRSLTRFFAEQFAQYAKDDAPARALQTNGYLPPADDLPAAQLAAWTQVARVVLNLHETIMRY
ncbi:MAG: PSD1 and planctomycete cytochrome C domain-containing protein [Verrucomicrobiales bacterium]